VAEGNALAFLESIEGGIGRRPAALKAFADAIAVEGAEVREVRALQGEQFAGWLGARARERGLQLDHGAAVALAERVGGFVRSGDVDRRLQSQLAISELEKLGLYRLDAEIRVEDVRALVPEAIPASLWAFVDAVGRRRGREALELLERAAAATPEPVLVALLHRRLRELIEVLDLVSSGSSMPEIGKAMKIGHEYRIRMLVEQARSWEPHELDAALGGLLDLDALIKSGSGRRRVQLGFVLWISDLARSGTGPGSGERRWTTDG
jgi:DNA polymerase III delta subunit